LFFLKEAKERKIFLECDSNNNFFSQNGRGWSLLCAFHVVHTRSAYSENSDFLNLLHCFSSSIF